MTDYAKRIARVQRRLLGSNTPAHVTRLYLLLEERHTDEFETVWPGAGMLVC
jgi:hypothetical protein